jgi:hypothetical protein
MRQSILGWFLAITSALGAAAVPTGAFAQGFPGLPVPQPQPPPPPPQAPGPPPPPATGPRLAPAQALRDEAPAGAPVGLKRKTTGTGIVVVTTEPPGATVLLDGKEVGVTPVQTAGVRAGWANVRLMHRDHADVAGYVEVTADQVTRVKTKLTPAEGTLTVVASMEGARVRIDGRDFGEAPVTVIGLSPGSAQVEVRAGLATFSETVRVEKGRTRLVNARLEAPATVTFTVRQDHIAACTHMDAELFVGDRRVGVVPNGGAIEVAELLPGEYPYRLRVTGACPVPGTWVGQGTLLVAQGRVYTVVGGTQAGQVTLR